MNTRSTSVAIPSFKALAPAQGNKCAYPPCPGAPTLVDHDHGTDRVRHLLCPWCNFTLGHLHLGEEMGSHVWAVMSSRAATEGQR
jgi:hypothetical protein